MKQADEIRAYARERYVAPARGQHEKKFSIRTGDVVRDIETGWRTHAGCLQRFEDREFLNRNALRLVSRTGPQSGQSTTVTYTYEFLDDEPSPEGKTPSGSGDTPRSRQDARERLRGALKDVFAEYGGGEAYLRAERASFSRCG